MDKSKKKKKNSFFRGVIVLFEDEDGQEEKETKVKRSSYRKAFSGEPRTFEEAAVMQHQDLERAMIDLATMFASLGLRQNTEALRLFNDELNLARSFQQKQGSKARFRNVLFTPST